MKKETKKSEIEGLSWVSCGCEVKHILKNNTLWFGDDIEQLKKQLEGNLKDYWVFSIIEFIKEINDENYVMIILDMFKKGQIDVVFYKDEYFILLKK